MINILLFGSSILIHRYFLINQSFKDYKIDSNTLGVTFGPTGSLFMYSHGIAAYLEEHFDLNNIIFASNSGGCQPAFFLASGIGMENALHKWYLPMMNDIIEDKLKHPFLTTAFKRSKRYLGKLINQKIIDNLNGKLFMVITHLPFLLPIIVGEFSDFDDFFYVVQATQYIPFLFGWPCALYNKMFVCDGWLSCKINRPIKNIKWLRLDPFKWNKFKFIDGFGSFYNFHNINYNLELRKLGYQDAKKNHHEFIEFGLKLKKISKI